MFSVYGRAGRVFRGSMEDLRHVGPVDTVARSRAILALKQDPNRQSAAPFQELLPQEPTGVVHRSALAAYAQTVKPEMPRQPLTAVHAIMSSPVSTIADTATVQEAWHMLSLQNLGQAPVVSQDGVLVGLFSRAELMQPQRLPGPESHALAWRALLMEGVVDLMRTPVPSVAPDTDIRRVARVLLDTNLPGLPVVDDDGKVTGFVSRSDILRAVVADPPLDLWG